MTFRDGSVRQLIVVPPEREPVQDLSALDSKLGEYEELLERCHAGFSAFIMGRCMSRKARDKLRADIRAALDE